MCSLSKPLALISMATTDEWDSEHFINIIMLPTSYFKVCHRWPCHFLHNNNNNVKCSDWGSSFWGFMHPCIYIFCTFYPWDISGIFGWNVTSPILMLLFLDPGVHNMRGAAETEGSRLFTVYWTFVEENYTPTHLFLGCGILFWFKKC